MDCMLDYNREPFASLCLVLHRGDPVLCIMYGLMSSYQVYVSSVADKQILYGTLSALLQRPDICKSHYSLRPVSREGSPSWEIYSELHILPHVVELQNMCFSAATLGLQTCSHFEALADATTSVWNLATHLFPEDKSDLQTFHDALDRASSRQDLNAMQAIFVNYKRVSTESATNLVIFVSTYSLWTFCFVFLTFRLGCTLHVLG